MFICSFLIQVCSYIGYTLNIPHSYCKYEKQCVYFSNKDI